MQKKETVQKYLILLIGLFFMGMGVALTKCAELGLSTISSVPNVMSIKFKAVSMGSWLSIWNCVMIIVQILILRKEFSVMQLLQIPVSFVFGFWCVAVYTYCFGFIHIEAFDVGSRSCRFGLWNLTYSDIG